MSSIVPVGAQLPSCKICTVDQTKRVVETDRNVSE